MRRGTARARSVSGSEAVLNLTRRALAGLLLVVALTPGCGAIGNVLYTDREGEGVPYGGTQWDVQLIADGVVVAVVDLPASFTVDTVCLPFTVTYTLLRGTFPGKSSWRRHALSHFQKEN